MKELDELRSIFLANDVDEETRAENEEQIREWERSIRENQAYAQWQSHDITKQISSRAKKAYQDAALRLATDRQLTDSMRYRLYAEQDACLWVLSLAEKDAKGAIESLKATITSSLNATK